MDHTKTEPVSQDDLELVTKGFDEMDEIVSRTPVSAFAFERMSPESRERAKAVLAAIKKKFPENANG